MLKNIVKNIVVLLFVATIGFGVGLYYGWLEGRESVNNWLVISTFNSAYAQGRIEGGAETIYAIFYDYVQQSPYSLEEEK